MMNPEPPQPRLEYTDEAIFGTQMMSAGRNLKAGEISAALSDADADRANKGCLVGARVVRCRGRGTC